MIDHVERGRMSMFDTIINGLLGRNHANVVAGLKCTIADQERLICTLQAQIGVLRREKELNLSNCAEINRLHDKLGGIRARSKAESLLNDIRKQAVDRLVAQAQARFRDSTGKGFTVTCNQCGSKNVHLNNSLDYHPGDGEWGEVTLKCWDCDDEIELLDGIYDRR